MNRTVYATAYSFSDAGIAMVTEDGKCGFQATDGKLKVEAKYTEIVFFVPIRYTTVEENLFRTRRSGKEDHQIWNLFL